MLPRLAEPLTLGSLVPSFDVLIHASMGFGWTSGETLTATKAKLRHTVSASHF